MSLLGTMIERLRKAIPWGIGIYLVVNTASSVVFPQTTHYPNWQPALELGQLDIGKIGQSKGISHSEKNVDRLFHVNESAEDADLQLTSLTGAFQQTIHIEDVHTHDVADLTYGSCGSIGSAKDRCLIVGDVGDSYLNRATKPELIFIRDQKTFADSISAAGKIGIRYPKNRHHDVAGLAMHPNGDIYLLARDVDFSARSVGKSILFRLPKKRWHPFPNSAVEAEVVGSLDLAYLMYEFGFWGRQVTSMEISPDGTSVVILTYQHAVELFIDLSSSSLKAPQEMKEHQDYRIIKLKRLAQQEALTYLRGVSKPTLVYTTAYHGSSIPLMAVFCAH